MKVSELLSDESKWCQWAWAVNSCGFNVSVLSEHARRWDLPGAISKCYGPGVESGAVFARVQEATGANGLANWNDTHTYAEVKALVDELGI